MRFFCRNFFYLHRPKGSPDDNFIFKGIPPTGPLPGSIDFALYPQTESDDFSIIVTSDPQPYELQHLEWYAQTALPEFRKHKSAVFGIACGDIVGDLLDLYTPYNKINALCGFPWYNVVGNHDLNFMAPDDTHAAETFRRVFGPTTYVFQYARVHFIILDNVYWEGFNGFRDDGWPNRNQYHGKIRQRDFDYIRNYLQHVDKGDRIVICSHIPLYNRADEHPRHGTPELTDLMQLLSPFRYTLSFSGHTHINHNHYLDAGQGYQAPDGATHHHCNLTSTCGSWYRGPVSDSGVPFSPGRDGSPKGYALVHFSGASDYKIEVLPLDFGGECHYGIDLPQVLATDELPSTSAQINVFAGSAKTRVQVRVDDRSWTDCPQIHGRDRRFIKLRQRSLAHPDAGFGVLSHPLAMDHLWEFNLPTDLPIGWHELHVCIVGDFGDVIEGKHNFWVVADRAELPPLSQGTRTTRTI